jgi:hypothetical protein
LNSVNPASSQLTALGSKSRQTCYATSSVSGARTAHIRGGERFSIRISSEENGTLDFPVPTPVGTAVRFVGRRQTIAEYVAQSLGRARLLARHTRFCLGIDPEIGSCTTFIVDVIR